MTGLSPLGTAALVDHGIRLRRETPGEHRAACPECTRAKPRRGDDALAVKLDPDGGATWVCHRCGWSGGLPPPREPWRPPRRPAPPKPEAPDPKAERNRELAQAIWRETLDLCACADGGRAWRYLTERRGLSRWVGDRLRWHPACPWGAGTAGCVVAPVNDAATGLVVGVWRIRPALEGPVERRGLGPTKGNACRLSYGPGPALAIAEGVEDALAYQQMSGLPTWAALSAGNMAELALPDRFREVHVVADADDTGRVNAARLVRRLRAEGRAAQMIEPVGVKDANAVLLAGRTAA